LRELLDGVVVLAFGLPGLLGSLLDVTAQQDLASALFLLFFIQSLLFLALSSK